jgi:hypothetical protein
MDGGKPMSEYYEGSSEEEEGVQGLNKLEEALNRAVAKYFDHNPDKHGADVTFRLVELYVIGRHNPIHGYRVVLSADRP